jgi:hypothetical protein
MSGLRSYRLKMVWPRRCTVRGEDYTVTFTLPSLEFFCMGPKRTSIVVLHAVIEVNIRAHYFVVQITNTSKWVWGKTEATNAIETVGMIAGMLT